MKSRLRPLGFMVALVLTFAQAPGSGFSGVAVAASEDVAMFYDDLSQYGQWVEYENYGPVWRPSQVPEDWRPYINGRWVPTDEGNVFESEEPWAWATYHYGNWMPSAGYGWVWVPGRTWYPSTVEWRASPESEPAESSYIGWAPTPPPDYVPPPAYAPPSYYPGSPVTDALIAPLWIFAKAAQFLLGFGQPYTSAYSYATSGVLLPPSYVPVFFARTVFIPAYAPPTYYPPAFFGGRRFGPGYYNMGPSAAYFARVTNLNRTIINQTIIRNSTHITRIHHVVPPRRVLERHGCVRQIIPPALALGRRLPPPRLAPNVKLAQVHLNRPNFVPPPKNVPRLTANIPRVQPLALPPDRGLPGTDLPSRATLPLTPQMTQQIQQLPPKQQFAPAPAQPFAPVTTPPPGTGPVRPGQVQPAVPAQPGKPGAPSRPGPGQVPPGPRTKPGQVQPGSPAPPVQVQPGGPAGGRAKPGEFHPVVRPGIQTTPAAPGTPPSGAAPLPPGYKGLTPEQRRQQEIEPQRRQRGGAAGPPQAQPMRQQQQLQQQNQERQRQRQFQQQQPRQQKMQQQQQTQQHERPRQQQLQQQHRQPQMQQQQQHPPPRREERKKQAPQ